MHTAHTGFCTFCCAHCLGTEVGLADTVQVDLSALSTDLAKDLLQYGDHTLTDKQAYDMIQACTSTSAKRDPLCISLPSRGTARGSALPIELEQDFPVAIQPQARACTADTDPTFHSYDDVARQVLEKWFPNSFKITGIKHVCDNCLGSILPSLPQILGSECYVMCIYVCVMSMCN